MLRPNILKKGALYWGKALWAHPFFLARERWSKISILYYQTSKICQMRPSGKSTVVCVIDFLTEFKRMKLYGVPAHTSLLVKGWLPKPDELLCIVIECECC